MVACVSAGARDAASPGGTTGQQARTPPALDRPALDDAPARERDACSLSVAEMEAEYASLKRKDRARLVGSALKPPPPSSPTAIPEASPAQQPALRTEEVSLAQSVGKGALVVSRGQEAV
jgi:hypothetical protein